MQDAAAAQSDFTQTIELSALAVGEAGLQLLRYGPEEARITGSLRTDGVVRAAGGFIPPAYTSVDRDAIPLAGSIVGGVTQQGAPFTMVIYNLTTNRLEINLGIDTARNWQPVGSPAASAGFVGMMIPWSRAVTTTQLNAANGPQEVQPGWFLANGAAISRTTYASLWDFFRQGSGTSPWGNGDGSTTFNLPSFIEGRSPIGQGIINFLSVGVYGGEINHAQAASEMALHSHPDAGVGVSVGMSTFNNVATWIPGQPGGGPINITAVTSVSSVSGNTGNAGANAPANNMQPYGVVGGWIIKYS